jgi:hypothetical protein
MLVRSTVLVARLVRYFSKLDEDMFFAWLERIACVSSFHGEGVDLLITLKRSNLLDDELRELIALFYRYSVDMTQLAQFETDANRSWFRDPSSYWHERVFGLSARRNDDAPRF